MMQPRVLIIGPGRHGKDTVAERLYRTRGLTYRSSSRFVAQTVIMPALEGLGICYPDVDSCYADRVNHRDLWREIIEDFNAEDPARLAKAILSVADCYVGMRMPREFAASRDLFDHILWVDATGRGVPPEPKSSMGIEYVPGEMLMIANDGALEELHAKVDTWAAMYLPQR